MILTHSVKVCMAMAEHFLHIPDVGSATVHVGGTGVTPKVARTGFVDAAAVQEFLDPVAEVSRTYSDILLCSHAVGES